MDDENESQVRQSLDDGVKGHFANVEELQDQAMAVMRLLKRLEGMSACCLTTSRQIADTALKKITSLCLSQLQSEWLFLIRKHCS